MALPKAGYLAPAAHAGGVAKELQLHGVRYQVLKAPLAPRALEVFRATEAKEHRTNSPSFSRAST